MYIYIYIYTHIHIFGVPIFQEISISQFFLKIVKYRNPMQFMNLNVRPFQWRPNVRSQHKQSPYIIHVFVLYIHIYIYTYIYISHRYPIDSWVFHKKKSLITIISSHPCFFTLPQRLHHETPWGGHPVLRTGTSHWWRRPRASVVVPRSPGKDHHLGTG